jgi:hypothetical protein
MLTVSDATHPGSNVPGFSLFASPWPPFRCVCLPDPAGGVYPLPLFHAATKARNRPTVTSYLSSRYPVSDAGSASPVGPPPVFWYVRS